MKRVYEYFEASVSRTEQLKNRRRVKLRQEQAAKRKLDARRNYLIGELVCKYFPSVMQYQPQRNQADNKAEFADLESRLQWLSEHTEILKRIPMGKE